MSAANPLFGRYNDVDYNEAAQEGLTGLYVTFGLYFLSLVGIAFWAFRTKLAAEQNAAAAKSRVELQAHYTGTYHPCLIALTIFSTAFSGYTVIGVPQTTQENGWYVLQFFSGVCAQSLAMLIFFPRLRRIGIERGYLSPTDFVSDRYRNKTVTILAVTAACLPQFIYLAVQLASFGETLNGLSRGLVTKFWGSLIAVIFMLTMEILGGMHSVVMSDVIQAIIMLTGFIILTFVLLSNYSVLEMGSETCPTAGTYDGTTTRSCSTGDFFGSDSVPYGCIPQGIRDFSMFKMDPNTWGSMLPAPTGPFPPFFMNGRYFWFVVNFLAFPLNPHLVQRMFLAEKDAQLVGVVKLLILSPYVAMGPGVLAGVAVAAHWNFWGPQSGCASAFATLGVVLQQDGGAFIYGLVSLLSCAALAAIMSSADSVILGVSNAVTVDIYRNMVNPDADPSTPVRIGQVISVVMALISFWFCMEINGDTFLNWLNVQNGILFQIAPAVLLGLYTDVKASAIFAGLVAGYIVAIPAIYVMLFGSGELQTLKGVLTGYFSAPSLASAMNFLTVFIAHKACSGEAAPASGPYNDVLEKLAIFDGVAKYNDPLVLCVFQHSILQVPNKSKYLG